MRIKLPDWVKPSPKGAAENAVASLLLEWGQRLLLAVLGMLIPAGTLVKIFAAPPTDRDWFWWTLYACVAMAITWAAVEFARTQRARRTAGDAPSSRAAITVGQKAEPSVEPKPPVELIVEGAWLNTPFHFSAHGVNEHNQTICAEDAYVTIRALDSLESVRVQFIVSLGRRTHEYWHEGVFKGEITPGMTERIRFYRRTFRFVPITFQRDGSPASFRTRKDMQITFFDGTPAEVKDFPKGLTTVKVYVHRKGENPYRGSLVIDSDPIHAPRSRLTVTSQMKLVVNDNFRRPFGDGMIYDEDPP